MFGPLDLCVSVLSPRKGLKKNTAFFLKSVRSADCVQRDKYSEYIKSFLRATPYHEPNGI